MEELVSKLAEILEVDTVDVTKKFTDYEEFDSLASLTILAMLDADYKKNMKASMIRDYNTIEEFCKDVLA